MAKNAENVKMAKNAVKFLLLFGIAGPALALTEQQVHPHHPQTNTAAKKENCKKRCLHLGGYDAEDCGHDGGDRQTGGDVRQAGGADPDRGQH